MENGKWKTDFRLPFSDIRRETFAYGRELAIVFPLIHKRPEHSTHLAVADVQTTMLDFRKIATVESKVQPELSFC